MSNEKDDKNIGEFYFNNSIPVNNKILTNGIKCLFLKAQNRKIIESFLLSSKLY